MSHPPTAPASLPAAPPYRRRTRAPSTVQRFVLAVMLARTGRRIEIRQFGTYGVREPAGHWLRLPDTTKPFVVSRNTYDSLRSRGWIDASGCLTPAGRSLFGSQS